MQLNISGDTKAVARDLGVKLPRLTNAAQVTALNRTSAKIGTAFRRGLSAETGIQQKVLRKKFRRYGATRRKPRTRVWYGLGTRIPVSEVLKGKGRKLPAKLEQYIDLKGAYSKPFQVALNGRPSTLHYRTGPDRYPIRAVKLDLSPVAKRVMYKVAPEIAQREYPKELARDIRRRLKGYNGRQRSR